jgi:hypothetical protein
MPANTKPTGSYNKTHEEEGEEEDDDGLDKEGGGSEDELIDATNPKDSGNMAAPA